jgi:hypothetical protein
MRERNIGAMEVRGESQQHFATILRDHMARTVWLGHRLHAEDALGGCLGIFPDARSAKGLRQGGCAQNKWDRSKEGRGFSCGGG